MKRLVSPEIIEDFKKDVANGMKNADLCVKYGIERSTAINWKRVYIKEGKPCRTTAEIYAEANRKIGESTKERWKVRREEKNRPKEQNSNIKEVDCDEFYKACKYGHCGSYKCDYCGKTNGLIRGGSPHHCTKYEQGTPSREGGYE